MGFIKMALKNLRAIDTVSYFFHGIPSIHFSAMDFPGTIGPNTSDWTIGVISLHNSSSQFKLGTFLSLKVWKERTVLAKSEAASFQKKLAHKQSSLWSGQMHALRLPSWSCCEVLHNQVNKNNMYNLQCIYIYIKCLCVNNIRLYRVTYFQLS